MTEPETSPRWKIIARTIILLPQRVILAIMAFFSVVIAYGMRVCLSITVIALVKTKHQSINNTNYECPIPDDYETDVVNQNYIYTWDEALIGRILSSLYIGYVITHLPGGILSGIWGGKLVLNGCIFFSSLFTLITPLSIIYGGAYCLIVTRILIGAAQGVLFPAINVLLAAWIPKDERAFYGAMVYGASQIGVVFGTSISGLTLFRYNSWEMVYYIYGIGGMVWCIFFTILCSSEPQNHLYISKIEKEMLLEKIGIIKRTTRIREEPWQKMLVNIPLLALVIANCGHDFGFFAMVLYLPKYLSDVLHYNMQTNGLLSAVPFISMYVVSILSGRLADFVTYHNIMSLTNCRKLYAIIASLPPAIGLVLASYAGCNRTLVVIAFTISMALMGFFYSSLRINGLDLGPNFAGTIMAYINGTGAMMGIISPIVVGMLTTNSTVLEYRTVFWITFCLFNGTCLVYLFYGSAEIQPFNDQSSKTQST